jgi:transcription attenuation protein (tryptophan RNA-binding attenuator protein)
VEQSPQPIASGSDFVVIKALAGGVTIIGMTRGRDTRFHHTEKLDQGEVMIAQFTENTSAIKVRGKAQILTRHGEVYSGEE